MRVARRCNTINGVNLDRVKLTTDTHQMSLLIRHDDDAEPLGIWKGVDWWSRVNLTDFNNR